MKDELRIPRDGAMCVTRTRDGGESWDILREGLPQRDAFDLVYRHGLDVDATGSRLVMGSTTGAVGKQGRRRELEPRQRAPAAHLRGSIRVERRVSCPRFW
jgi:hypothetical protein